MAATAIAVDNGLECAISQCNTEDVLVVCAWLKPYRRYSKRSSFLQNVDSNARACDDRDGRILGVRQFSKIGLGSMVFTCDRNSR
jgi:hypothetical protein